ncbi:HAD family hydrolase [Pseudobacteroides cellulosolvens]|uniref:HAD-superfamily hydrolase, subfamily IA, variant 1 n=1 Tax=Pseudobacteroides cellulosolvens ATCC 35603 = DSM 2933 TaxID=398512 RepID=A0A0L6JLM5_9FIRM|nr:HAD-IA family hydrolase [Pseudobacteroides cellulosolvens]KNY26277.1 HAD-superfamily hydrolase, subfamily IA, variant 1 [Pseudobacteroides cellulosolvens ATCC 35603 = DSM 2933]
MKIDAIIFDLDGTLADTIPLTIYALKKAVLELSGKEYKDEEILNEFGPVDTEIIKKLLDYKHDDIAPDVYIKHFESSFNDFVKPIEGIERLLKFISSNDIKLGLFTGRGRRATGIIVEKLGLNEMFNILITGDDTRKHKPDPEGILKALDLLSADKQSSYYVGDFDVDIYASRAAGVNSVLALWASSGDERLNKHNPDYCFKNPQEFIDALEDIMKR